MRSFSYHVVPATSILLGVLFGHTVFASPVERVNYVSATECPRIVSREEWKARQYLDFKLLPVTPTPYVVVHHGGIPKYCNDQESCSAIVRSYQDLHLDDRGWWDVGYNFLVGEDGNVYTGRGWDFVGAHAPGYNTQSIGICVLGDFSDFLPNSAALKALNKLIACGVSLGKISDKYNVIGHRQTRITDCPGESFYNYVIALPRWTASPIPHFTNSTTATTTTTTTTTTTSTTKMEVTQSSDDNNVEENGNSPSHDDSSGSLS